MRILEALANIFINTFGITQPTDAARRQAAWFIFGLMVIALVIITMIGLVIFRVVRHG